MKPDSSPLIVLFREGNTNGIALHSQIFQSLYSHYFQCFCPSAYYQRFLLKNNTAQLDFTSLPFVNLTFK